MSHEDLTAISSFNIACMPRPSASIIAKYCCCCLLHASASACSGAPCQVYSLVLSHLSIDIHETLDAFQSRQHAPAWMIHVAAASLALFAVSLPECAPDVQYGQICEGFLSAFHILVLVSYPWVEVWAPSVAQLLCVQHCSWSLGHATCYGGCEVARRKVLSIRLCLDLACQLALHQVYLKDPCSK